MSRDLRELLHATAEPPTRPVDSSRIVDEAERRTLRHRVGLSLAAAAVILAGALTLPPLIGGGWTPRIGEVEPIAPAVGDPTIFASGQIPSGEWTASVWLEQPQGTYTICIEVRHGVAQDLGCTTPIDDGQIMDVGPSGWQGDGKGDMRPAPAVYGQVASGVAKVVVVLDDGTQAILAPRRLEALGVAVVGHAFPADRYPVQILAFDSDGELVARDSVPKRVTDPDATAEPLEQSVAAATEVGIDREDCRVTLNASVRGVTGSFASAEAAARSVEGLPAEGRLVYFEMDEDSATFGWVARGVPTHIIDTHRGDGGWTVGSYQKCAAS